MLFRLFLGLLKGAIVGGLVAVPALFLLGGFTLSAPFAYLAAGLAGVLVGLIAGRVPWTRQGWTEAKLRMLVGLVLAPVMLLGLRWLVPPGSLFGWMTTAPAVFTPLIATLLATFYELDNDGKEPAQLAGKAGAKARIAERVRVGSPVEAELEEERATQGKGRARR